MFLQLHPHPVACACYLAQHVSLSCLWRVPPDAVSELQGNDLSSSIVGTNILCISRETSGFFSKAIQSHFNHLVHGFGVPFTRDGTSESTITEKLIGIRVSILQISHVYIIITHIAIIVVAIQSETSWQKFMDGFQESFKIPSALEMDHIQEKIKLFDEWVHPCRHSSNQ